MRASSSALNIYYSMGADFKPLTNSPNASRIQAWQVKIQPDKFFPSLTDFCTLGQLFSDLASDDFFSLSHWFLYIGPVVFWLCEWTFLTTHHTRAYQRVSSNTHYLITVCWCCAEAIQWNLGIATLWNEDILWNKDTSSGSKLLFS
jgi:hypothetical protein